MIRVLRIGAIYLAVAVPVALSVIFIGRRWPAAEGQVAILAEASLYIFLLSLCWGRE